MSKIGTGKVPAGKPQQTTVPFIGIIFNNIRNNQASDF
jgi:hypothetical protein